MMLRRKTILPILILVIAIAARWIPWTRTIDDSYITFRYARNILAGEGFVYNPGEPVMGTTTPLYTLLMVSLGAFSGGTEASFPTLALFVNSLADAITALLLWQIGRYLKQPLAGLAAALVWAVLPYSVTFAIGGLETSLYVLLLTGAFYCYLTRRIFPAAFLGSLAILTRPDAIILLIPIALDHLVRILRKQEKLRWQDILALVLLPLMWYSFATLQFGSPIPHSVQAKLGAYRLDSTEALVRLIQHFATPFMSDQWFGSRIAVAGGMLLYPALFAIGALKAFKTNARTLPFILYPWLYFLVFSVANPLIFRWYLTPPLPAYLLFILIGIHTLVSVLLPRLKIKAKKLQTAILVLVLILLPLANLLSAWSWKPDHGLQHPAPAMTWYELELIYGKAADIISPYLQHGETLAAGDVGVLGYFTRARILDTVGLNSPEALDYYPLDKQAYVINYAIAPDLIIDQQPDAVIFLEVYGRNGLLKDKRFLEQYQLIRTLPTNIYGSNGMLIYVKR
ncbi:MAG: glycosyltransferase family protein [Anaerolineaceae bacterium]